MKKSCLKWRRPVHKECAIGIDDSRKEISEQFGGDGVDILNEDMCPHSMLHLLFSQNSTA